MKRIFRSIAIVSLMMSGITFPLTASSTEGIFDKLKPKSSEQTVESNDIDNEDLTDSDDGELFKPSNVRLTWGEVYDDKGSISNDGEYVTFTSKKNNIVATRTMLPINPKKDFFVDFVFQQPKNALFGVIFISPKGNLEISTRNNFAYVGEDGVVFPRKLEKKSKSRAFHSNGDINIIGVERKGKHLILSVNGENVYEAVADSNLQAQIAVFYTGSKTPGQLLAVHIDQDEEDGSTDNDSSDEN